MKTYAFIVTIALLLSLAGFQNKPEPRFFMVYFYGLDSLGVFKQGEIAYWAYDGRMPTQEDVLKKIEKHRYFYPSDTINVNNLDVGLRFHMIPFEFKSEEDKISWAGGKKYKAIFDKFYKP